MRTILCLFVVFLGMCDPGAADSPDRLCYIEDLEPGFATQFTFFNVKEKWENARDACNSIGGRLATINNEDLHNAIIAHIDEEVTLKEAAGRGYWIGANDLGVEGEFFFVDSGEELTYLAGWYKNEPNNNTKKDPINGQDCVQLWQKPRYTPKWQFDDAYCYKRKGYICEVLNGCVHKDGYVGLDANNG